MKKLSKFLLITLCSFLFITTITPAPAKATTLEHLIEFKCHVSNIGWMPWVGNGGTGGIPGQSLPMEAIRIRFADGYTIPNLHLEYRVHVSNIGWMPWVRDGQTAGTTGQALSIEAIEIEIVDDDGNIRPDYWVGYTPYLRNIGWTSIACMGRTAGTTGQGIPMEALQITVNRETLSTNKN